MYVFIEPENRSGACPDKELLTNKSCEKNTCQTDADCNLDQKCCPNSCFNLHCTYRYIGIILI
jgi:hypothetical protein